MQYQITASIVTYKHTYSCIKPTIDSFFNTNLKVHLYIVDNSPTDKLGKELPTDKLSYIFLNRNEGFGAGHNEILRNQSKLGEYHIVLNPDIYFSQGQLEKMFDFMENSKDCGLLMPNIIYPSGEIQYLAKLLPTPRDWVFRRFLSFLPSTKKRDEIFELRFSGYNKVMNVPYLSGCFMFLRKSVINEIGFFDEGIFMYGEDTDLSRRIHMKYKTMFFPEAIIVHEFQKESHKSFRLLWIHIKAAIYYFNKWGWFFDIERKNINNKVLKELGYNE